MVIRPATHQDIPQLTALAGRFFAASSFAKFLDCSESGLSAAIERVIDAGIIFVVVSQDVIIGGLAGIMAPAWFAPENLVATEVGWWVDQDQRGGIAAIRLLHRFEDWAKESGATAIAMSDMVMSDGSTPAGGLFDRMGYALSERSHIKRIA